MPLQECLITIIRRDNGLVEGVEQAENEFLAMCWISERVRLRPELHPFTYRLEWDGQIKEVTGDDFHSIKDRYSAWEE